MLIGLVRALLDRLDRRRAARCRATEPPSPEPEAPAPELVPVLRRARGRVMEMCITTCGPTQRDEFLAAMDEVRQVRGRAGALVWQLYEDVAHPEGWLEVWSMESWTDHLREVTRLSAEDRATLARVGGVPARRGGATAGAVSGGGDAASRAGVGRFPGPDPANRAGRRHGNRSIMGAWGSCAAARPEGAAQGRHRRNGLGLGLPYEPADAA